MAISLKTIYWNSVREPVLAEKQGINKTKTMHSEVALLFPESKWKLFFYFGMREYTNLETGP